DVIGPRVEVLPDARRDRLLVTPCDDLVECVRLVDPEPGEIATIVVEREVVREVRIGGGVGFRLVGREDDGQLDREQLSVTEALPRERGMLDRREVRVRT